MFDVKFYSERQTLIYVVFPVDGLGFKSLTPVGFRRKEVAEAFAEKRRRSWFGLGQNARVTERAFPGGMTDADLMASGMVSKMVP